MDNDHDTPTTPPVAPLQVRLAVQISLSGQGRWLLHTNTTDDRDPVDPTQLAGSYPTFDSAVESAAAELKGRLLKLELDRRIARQSPHAIVTEVVDL